VGAASSLTAFANIYEWPGICRLIYVVQFKCHKRTAQPISVGFYTSNTRCQGTVSGGFTRDLQALPGHLAVAYPLDPAVAWAPAGFGGR